MTGNTIQSLHGDLDELLSAVCQQDQSKAEKLLSLLKTRLDNELAQEFSS